MSVTSQVPDAAGRYGPFGGRFVPETLTRALEQLATEYDRARRDRSFQAELDDLLEHYVGRPSPLYHAARLSQRCGGAQIYLKREDLNHTGSHKINNTLGQALLTRQMGKRRVIAETGAGQHGVATATACARFGFECVIYMGEEDIRRQKPNVFSMRLLGRSGRSPAARARFATRSTEAFRDWMALRRNDPLLHRLRDGPAPVPQTGATFSRSSAVRPVASASSSSAGFPTWWSPAWAAAAMRPGCFFRSLKTRTSNC